MKKILSLSFIVFALSSGIMAQKGFEVQKEITVDVSAEALWEMVGPGFIEVYKWSSNVDHATGKGNSPFEGAVCDERFCDVNVSGFSKISEKLTHYDKGNMSLTYAVIGGMPGFVQKAENNWTVVAIDDSHSKLVMKANFEVKGFMGFMMKGMMKGKMNKTLDTVLMDAKVYAETGQISENKAKRIAQLEKKNKVAK
ncbi:MAG: SRPBCC family protein [Bacteroidia bacterium]